MRMRDRFARFMYGRYGVDELGRFSLFTSLLFIIFSSVFKWTAVYYIFLLIFILTYFRMFSKNIGRRRAENNVYLSAKAKVGGFFRRIFRRSSSSSGGSYSSGCNCYKGNYYEAQYKVFKCPKCRQKLRVPRGKGKIQISCRRCGHEFIKKT